MRPLRFASDLLCLFHGAVDASKHHLVDDGVVCAFGMVDGDVVRRVPQLEDAHVHLIGVLARLERHSLDLRLDRGGGGHAKYCPAGRIGALDSGAVARPQGQKYPNGSSPRRPPSFSDCPPLAVVVSAPPYLARCCLRSRPPGRPRWRTVETSAAQATDPQRVEKATPFFRGPSQPPPLVCLALQRARGRTGRGRAIETAFGGATVP